MPPCSGFNGSSCIEGPACLGYSEQQLLRFCGPWPDRVVPFRMELIAGDVDAFHCGLADLDALLVAARVERAFDLQTGFCGRRPDQLDHGKAIRQRPAAPV